MTLHRICLIVLLTGGLLLPAVVARAEDKPEESGGGGPSAFRTFIKVPPITAEFWGEDGFYHGLDLSVTLQCSLSISLSKKLPELIRVALTARPWEDYTKGNPAKLIKAIVMSEVQKESYGPLVEDVLITNLMVR